MAPPPFDSLDGVTATTDSAESAIGGAFTTAVDWLRGRLTLAELVDLIVNGRISAALDTEEVEQAAGTVAAAIVEQYTTGGKKVAEYLAAKLKEPVAFNVADRLVVNRLAGITSDRVVGLATETRQVISAAIAETTAQGMNPRAAARYIRGSIGLTEKQQEIVANYRRKLDAGDLSALDNALRDKRDDAKVRAAAEGKKPLTDAQKAKMTEAYQRRFVNYRAEVIARTEALGAVHQGSDDGWQQAIRSGKILPSQIEQTWWAHLDGRTRGSHRKMHKQKRAWGVPFITPSGISIRFPCDPEAPIEETAQCRCGRTIRFKRN